MKSFIIIKRIVLVLYFIIIIGLINRFDCLYIGGNYD